MKAQLLPLNGKYYGTIIRITHDDGETDEIKVWLSGRIPSDREFDNYCTREQWESNQMIMCSDNYEMEAKEYIGPWDCHFENEESLKVSKTIVEAINENN